MACSAIEREQLDKAADVLAELFTQQTYDLQQLLRVQGSLAPLVPLVLQLLATYRCQQALIARAA